MSPRAALRLEALGFAEVYDFVVGKAAWAATGLPMEGALTGLPRAGAAVRSGVFTCRMGDLAGETAASMDAGGQRDCIVLNDEGIVMGRTRRAALDVRTDARVEDLMEAGPSTVRPDAMLDGLVDRMRLHGTVSTVVTTPQGRFLGVLYREDAERLLGVEALESEQP